MKKILFLAALAALPSFGALRTYWSFTNRVNNLPDLEAGRIRFADGSSFDTNHGVGYPKFYEQFVLSDNPATTNVAPYRNLIGKPVLFANGRPIVIEPISGTAARVRVSWTRYVPTATYHSIDVPVETVVFGGSDGARGTDGNFHSTSVTVAGAKIRAIYGGSIGYGVVGNATISVTGDADIYLIYGSNLGFPFYNKDAPSDKLTRACVGRVTINVAGENARVEYLYGGGYSVSDVGVSDITVVAGRVDNLVPGPASGMAGSLITTIKGGYVDRLPAWSRGYVGTSTIKMIGGTVNKLCAGGDPDTFGDTSGGCESAFGGSVYLDLTGGTVCCRFNVFTW